MSTIAATCVPVENWYSDLSRIQEHRRKGELMAADSTTGPIWHRDGAQGDRYPFVFEKAVF